MRAAAGADGLLAAEAVWRLTANRLAAFAAAGLVVVTPWAVHQHGLLLPEQLGAPLLLGAALLASRPARRALGRRARGDRGLHEAAVRPAGGARDRGVAGARGAAARWAAGTIAAQALLFTALFGTGFWRQIVVAQVQAGDGLELQAGAFVQAAWNLLPLVVFAAVALALREQARERALLSRSPLPPPACSRRRSRSSSRARA